MVTNDRIPSSLTDRMQEVAARLRETGSTVPDQRSAFRRGYSFSLLPVEEQLMIWDVIWRTAPSNRIRLQAFFYVETIVSKPVNAPLIWQTVSYWQDNVSSWDHCDALAKIFTKLLETRCRDAVFTQLTLWNASPDLWKRRQSVVSLLYFHRTKKEYEPFANIAPLVKNLLADPEYYVQKGVGWTLREMHSVYPKETSSFVDKHLNQIHPIAFTITIEKMTAAEKDFFKSLRKSGRNTIIH